MDTTVTLDEFRHRCDELVAAVAETGEALVVTRRGVAVVRVEPAAELGEPAASSEMGRVIAPSGGPWDDFFAAPGIDFPDREQPGRQDREPL